VHSVLPAAEAWVMRASKLLTGRVRKPAPQRPMPPTACLTQMAGEEWVVRIVHGILRWDHVSSAMTCRMCMPHAGCSSSFLLRAALGYVPDSEQQTPCCCCRLWGWTSGDNCAFKDAYALPIYYPEYFTTPQQRQKESGTNVKPVLPSAAPPTKPIPSSAAVFEAAVSCHKLIVV
jgi:hypothetical protein